MTEGDERRGVVGLVVDVSLACASAALGIGSLAAGKIALGVPTLLLLGGLVTGEIVLHRGSESAVLVFALARPFLLGGWLLALAGAIAASQTNLDWIVILPFGVAYVALGLFMLLRIRQSRRDGRGQTDDS